MAPLAAVIGMMHVALAQFTLQGPGVRPADFRVTTFATGLNFPVGMTTLADGSVLVATSNGGSFSSTTSGSLIRLVDTNGDGAADVQQTLANSVAGGKLTSVRRVGDLIAVTGQGQSNPISFYRTGSSPGDPLTLVGQLTLTYSGGAWSHSPTSLLLRETPGAPGTYELYFQLGSDTNFARTTRTVALGGTLGLTATLAGDAVHRIKLSDLGAALTAIEHTQIATGLRNASGLAFHPQTGDFYIGENGIDGLININEPHSADELNVIPQAAVGGAIESFGFPDTYEQYRTGVTVGSTGILPLLTFQPIPMPDGSESEGVNEISFAPPEFPAALRHGLFAGFHGRFNLGGIQNEENPVVFVDLASQTYFQIIGNDEPAVGHLNGFLATHDTLYMADMSPTGALGAPQAGTGKIYAIRSLVPDLPGDYNNDGTVNAADYPLWRSSAGTFNELRNDPIGGMIGAAHYEQWRDHFGATAGAGSQHPANVPEAGAFAHLLMAGLAGFAYFRLQFSHFWPSLARRLRLH
jgi:glucose/arabinose dehydrogenase